MLLYARGRPPKIRWHRNNLQTRRFPLHLPAIFQARQVHPAAPIPPDHLSPAAPRHQSRHRTPPPSPAPENRTPKSAEPRKAARGIHPRVVVHPPNGPALHPRPQGYFRSAAIRGAAPARDPSGPWPRALARESPLARIFSAPAKIERGVVRAGSINNGGDSVIAEEPIARAGTIAEAQAAF